MSDHGLAPAWFSPPGQTILRLVSTRGLTISEVAARVGRPDEEFMDIVMGHRFLDDDLADQLGEELGPSGSFWKQRQADYHADLERVRLRIPPDVAEAWIASLPTKEIAADRTAEWIEEDIVRTCLVYFNVSSIDEWSARYTGTGALLKTSDTLKSVPGALATWLRRVERRASLTERGPLDKVALKNLLPDLRYLARSPLPEHFIPKAQELLASAGVTLVIVPQVEGSRASGVATFLDAEHAAIGLSLRHATNDHFWFTLFHEIGHLLLHDAGQAWVDEELNDNDERELEANEFAFDILIPSEHRSEYGVLPGTHRDVMRFAKRIGVHPAIVVGQLQHAGRVPFKNLNRLKRKIEVDAVLGAPA